jgi:hypothetical protein
MRRVPVYESPRWVNDMDLEFMDRDRAAGIKKSILGRGMGYRNIGSRNVPRIRWIALEQSTIRF